MTFVKARLAIEKIERNATIKIRLKAGEPLQNLPRSLSELGHSILSITPEVEPAINAIYILTVRKGQ